MTEVFADTSGWANYFVRSEPLNQLAVRMMRQWHATGNRLVTTNYILLELVALMTVRCAFRARSRSRRLKRSKLRHGWN
jgi:predicted nucleic acid-binding protein